MKSTSSLLSALPTPGETLPITSSSCLPSQPRQSKSSVLDVSRSRSSSSTSNKPEVKHTPEGRSKKQPSQSTTSKENNNKWGSTHLNGRTSLMPSKIQPKQPPGVPMVEQFVSPVAAREDLWINKIAASTSQSTPSKASEPVYPSLMDLQRVAPDLASAVAIQERVEDLLVHGNEISQDAKGRLQQTAASISSLVASDLLSVSVRHGLPRKVIAKGLRRFKRKEIALGPVSLRQRKRRRRLSMGQLQFTHVSGIPNLGGQSCFLNSVLQALASLPPFLVYLERIIQLQYQNEDLDETLSKGTASKDHLSLCECLLKNLRHVNGAAAEQVDPREILYRISKKHAQFRPRHGRLGRLNVGTEQQDAQELLQALLGMIILEAGLDSSAEQVEGPSSEHRLAVATPLDFSLEESTCSDQTEDSVLSLSSFLTRIDLEQKTASAKKNGRDGPLSQVPQEEEKKLDDSELSTESHQPPVVSAPPQQKQNDIVQRNLSASTLNMLKTLSPMTPSPLNGWIGSTLQCCTCHHVSPIQNAPFLDIPIVPTSISKYLSSGTMARPSSSPFPACSLNQCLRDFTSVERVGDVECRSCTIKQETSMLDEEILMLRGAVDTISARLQKSNREEDQVNAMRAELEAAVARYARLSQMDPDSECDVKEIFGDQDALYLEDISALGLPDSSRSTLVRGYKNKCLLLTRMPSVLCLHVQRRYYDPARNCMAKTLQHIDFPEFLDLGLHCAYGFSGGRGLTGRGEAKNEQIQRRHKPIPYKLMSIIEHRGNAHAGHYQTYRRAPPNARKEWVLVSDLSVTPLHWNEVKKCQAYMLFYEAM